MTRETALIAVRLSCQLVVRMGGILDYPLVVWSEQCHNRDIKEWVKGLPFVGAAIIGASQSGRRAYRKWGRSVSEFTGSESYWDDRYRRGGNSGAGSYGELAVFKAEVLNGFIADAGVETILELGCGDGNQLDLAVYPDYTGLDVSPTAIRACRKRFRGDGAKVFELVDEFSGMRSIARCLSMSSITWWKMRCTRST